MNTVKTNLKYTSTLTLLNLIGIQYIVLHHAEAISATPEDIHQWHLKNGWSGAGYNEYIRKDGSVYIIRGDNVGAHCYGYNSVSYGICCEGNYAKETEMPKAQFASLVERLKFHKARFKGAKIVGHKELYNTDCPGRFFPFKQVLAAVETPEQKPHWAKVANDELLAAGILTSDHTATLDKPATEGFVITLVNKIRKAGKENGTSSK